MKRIVTAGAAALAVFAALLPYSGPAGASTGPGPLARASSLSVTAPYGAAEEGAAPSTAEGSLEFVLAPSDPSGIASLLASLYDPASPAYHHWLTPAGFSARFGPSAATLAETAAWLRGRGLAPRRTSTFALTVHAPLGRLAAALGTTFRLYRTRGGAAGVVAEGAPLVPRNLRGQLAAIEGLSSLPALRSAYRPARPRAAGLHAAATARPASTSTSTTSSSCQQNQTAYDYGGVTMAQLTSAYGISSLQAAGLTGAGQTVGVYELAPYSASDVATYEGCFGLSNPVSRVSVDGGASPDPNGTAEADIDIEQVATQAPGARIISYEAPNTDQGAYDLWSKIVTADQAAVVSTSWGWCEADAWQSSQTSTATETLLAEAASDGQTVVVASGDSGSEGCATDYLYPPAPSYAGSPDVGYPASDPNVTAVGGTDYYGPGQQTAWNDCYLQGTGCAAQDGYQAASGGGLSAEVPRPSWQWPDVFDWPVGSNQPCGTSCREVPDVSANAGTPMVDYVGGAWGAGLGTSYAAPLVAGLVADRNQGCTAPTGNFAPLLYKLASTPGGEQYGFSLPSVSPGGSIPAVGNNDMLNTANGAYPVLAGYNLVTGLGTPVGQGLACPEVLTVSAESSGGQATVTGIALEDARILFGSQPATVVSQTATSATVDVPAGSGDVTVSAVWDGTAGTLTAPFSYPVPTTTTTTAPTTTTTTAPTTTTTTVAPATTTTVAPTTTTTTTTVAACPAAGGSMLAGAAGIASVSIDGCPGYYVVDSAGQVAAFGSAVWHGDLGAYHLAAPIIAIEATSDGNGYWLLGADGGVFAFGDARFYGSTGGIHLNAPVVGMAVTPDSRGYWIVAKDGGVFTFGDARFYGSTGNLKLVAPVDGIALAPGGNGYWLVAADGGVFTFTSDGFYGSLGGVHLAKPVVGMSSTPDGRGYTLVGSDGGVFSFGDAPFYGSLGGDPPAAPVADLSPAPANNGYYLVTTSGAVYSFGPGARYFGSV